MDLPAFKLVIFDWDLTVTVSGIKIIEKNDQAFLSFSTTWDDEVTTKTEDEVNTKVGEMLLLALEQSVFEYGTTTSG